MHAVRATILYLDILNNMNTSTLYSTSTTIIEPRTTLRSLYLDGITRSYHDPSLTLWASGYFYLFLDAKVHDLSSILAVLPFYVI